MSNNKNNKMNMNTNIRNNTIPRRFQHTPQSRQIHPEVPLIKGSCIWFAKNNWNEDKPLRKCRNGSFCRYLHLTGEECVYIIAHYNESEECIDCKWKREKVEEKNEEKREIITNIPIDSEGNRPKIFDDLANEKLWDKIRREMPCRTCNDTGKMLSKRKFNRVARLRNWCDCPKEIRLNSTTHHYPGNSHPSGEKDAWVCSRCNCICQVG